MSGINEAELPHIPEELQRDDGKLEAFKNIRPFVRNIFSWIMNWDIHYFLPIATTWVSPEAINWVTRFYLKQPF